MKKYTLKTLLDMILRFYEFEKKDYYGWLFIYDIPINIKKVIHKNRILMYLYTWQVKKVL